MIFEQALEITSPQERAGFLKGACGGDEQLGQRVADLLLAHEQAEGFLPEQPQAQPTLVPVTEQPGDRIDRYKLLQKLGEGGWGVVYMAEQEEPIRRRVALKVIKLGNERFGYRHPQRHLRAGSFALRTAHRTDAF